MIHPSTMAGPNWFTGSFGTINPFQQNTSAFSRTPYQGMQPGFGTGTTPFQSQPYGLGTQTLQLQNTINEIVRQVVPTILASTGFSPTNGFQTPFGQQGQFGFQTPFAFQTPTGPAQFGPQYPFNTGQGDWQTQNYLNEVIRQSTNQAIQNMFQQTPNTQFQTTFGLGTAFGATPTMFGQNIQQQNLTNVVAQACTQCCQQVCQTIVSCVTACLQQTPTQGTITGPIAQICQQACVVCCQQVCQTLVACVTACLQQQQQQQTQGTPFNLNNTSQYGVTSGIPTGAGAF